MTYIYEPATVSALNSLQAENESKNKKSSTEEQEVEDLKNKVQSMEDDNRTLIENVCKYVQNFKFILSEEYLCL